MADGPRRRRQRAAETKEPPGREAAFEIALRYLGSRPRTRWELDRRLRRAGAADDVITVTLERLETIGYVDDAAFARWWAEQRDRHAPRGSRMIEAELRQRGVGRDVVEGLRAGPGDERAPDDHLLPSTDAERARAALERHLKSRALPTDAKALQRVGTFLMRRGFDAETVRAVLRRAGADADDGES